MPQFEVVRNFAEQARATQNKSELFRVLEDYPTEIFRK
jgi:hypothetical protein